MCGPTDLTMRPCPWTQSPTIIHTILLVGRWCSSICSRVRDSASELRVGRGGAFRLQNNTGVSETIERRENAAEGGSRPLVADSGRER